MCTEFLCQRYQIVYSVINNIVIRYIYDIVILESDKMYMFGFFCLWQMFATNIHCCHAKMVKLDALNYVEKFIEQVTHWSVFFPAEWDFLGGLCTIRPQRLVAVCFALHLFSDLFD